MHVLKKRAFFPIHGTFLQMHKEHLATIFGYLRSNGAINPYRINGIFQVLVKVPWNKFIVNFFDIYKTMVPL